MKIFLIRHGQTTGDIEDRYGGDYDDHLTIKGKNQAKRLAEKLKSKDIEIIFSSPRIRALETAEILANTLELEIRVVENIRERNSYGALTGMIKTEAKKKYPELAEAIKDRTGIIAGVESYSNFKGRIINSIEELSKLNFKKIAIVTHSGPIYCFFREVFKEEIDNLSDCAIIELDADGTEYKLASIDN